MKNFIYLLSKLFFYGFSLFTILLTFYSILGVLEFYEIFQFSSVIIEDFGLLGNSFITIILPVIELKIMLRFGFLLLFILASLLFYSYYFYVLKEFFQLFINEKVFVETSLKKLHLFYKINYVPAIVFLGRALLSILKGFPLDTELVIISFIHFVIAILLYYYMDLVKKGMQVQEENDLTI